MYQQGFCSQKKREATPHKAPWAIREKESALCGEVYQEIKVECSVREFKGPELLGSAGCVTEKVTEPLGPQFPHL